MEAGTTPVLAHNCTTAVQDLYDAPITHGLTPSLLDPLLAMDDPELLRAVNNPNAGDFITLNEDGTVVQSHHRVAARAAKAADPENRITRDSHVTIQRYQRNLSMFDDLELSGSKNLDDPFAEGGVSDGMDRLWHRLFSDE